MGTTSTTGNLSTMPLSRTLPRLLDELAATYGPRPALAGGGRVMVDGLLQSVARRLTYTDWKAEALQVARRLYRLGVRPGDKVAILMGNRPEWISACFGISMLGATVVTINTWATVSELEYLLHHSDTTLLIASPAFLKADYGQMLRALEPHATRLPLLRGILGAGHAAGAALPRGWQPLFDGATDTDAAADAEISRAAAAVQPADIALLLYTSGSTSRPKGVQLQHYALIENDWNIGERMHVNADDRVWLAVSLFWGYGCANAMLNLLTHGGSIVLQEWFEPGEALRLIDEEKCTVYYGTANMAQALMAHPARAAHDLSTLRVGGSTGSREQVMRVMELGVKQVCNVFGLTETYGFSHITDAHDDLEHKFNSSGFPLPNVQTRVVSLDGVDLPPGEVGELRLKGYITPGYYKQPELSAQAFDEQGYFRTGDLVCEDAARYMQFRGRIKEMIKTGGINVAPAEVELLLVAYPGVALALVVGVPDQEREEIVAAVIAAKPGVTLDLAAITVYCKTHLAAYKVPRLLRVINEADLPLTTTGKVQKNRIAAVFFAPDSLRYPLQGPS